VWPLRGNPSTGGSAEGLPPERHFFTPSEPRGDVMKVVDPVCKMTIDSEKAAATSQYKGQTIYFCAKGCKAKFDQEPEKYFERAHH
jgi:Cu+-exporting ATPase